MGLFLTLLALPAAALQPGSYEVAVEKLHFREGPGTDTASQYLLALGSEVTVVECEGEWAYAEHEGAFGYLHTDYIAPKQPTQQMLAEELAPAAQVPLASAPPEPSASSIPQGMVKASSLNFREQANTDSPVIEALPFGTVVEIVEQQGEWTFISFNGVRGYVYAEYLGLPDENGSFFSEADEIIAFARQYLGYPYRRGGSSPSTGFDCSGFVRYVYSNFGVNLPMGATSQYNTLGRKLSRDELRTGDLVFFRAPGSKGIGHVGIYISAGSFIHSTKPGDVVSVDTMDSGYYRTYYYGAARVG